LIRRAPAAFFAWLAAAFLAAWRFRGWLDTSNLAFPGEPERVCDTVAEFVHRTDRNRRCLLDVEVQARPDGEMPERQGEYAFRLRRSRRHGRGQRGKYQVLSVLLNLSGPVQNHVLDMTEVTLDGAGLRLEVVQRTLREEDAAGTLARIASGELQRPVLPWIVLMRGAGRAAIIKEWCRLALEETDEQWRSDYAALVLVFVGLTRHAAAWRKALEGWNMERSPQVLEWQAQRERRAIRRVLEARFQEAVPADLAEVIAKLIDPDELDRWVEAAATALTLEAFRAAVGR
jgi:hypothetical protein